MLFRSRIDEASLAALRADPRVSAVSPDFEMRPLLNETVPFVRADVAWSRGDTGAGRYVAVLDSGISAHPMFRGDIAYEACFTVNASCTGHTKTAIGPGAAQECRIAECEHGMHVAGIAAGNAVTGQVPGGVGRGAGIIAIRVFRVVERDGTPTDGGRPTRDAAVPTEAAEPGKAPAAKRADRLPATVNAICRSTNLPKLSKIGRAHV